MHLHQEHDHGTPASRPLLLSFAGAGDGGPARATGVRGSPGERRERPARRPRRRGHGSRQPGLRPAGGPHDFPQGGNELHHFGWNACSSHLCPYAPNPHIERRYLVVPGTHSSRIHILDTKPDPRQPALVKVIEGDEVMAKTGYAAPHTVHCGPDGIYMNALGAPDGNGPGGIFMLDHETFEVKGRWEQDRGPQHLAYDFWWHLGHDTMITSEWGTPNMVKDGVNPELLLGGKYGNALHVWDLRKRTPPAEARPGRRAADGARAAARAQPDAAPTASSASSSP